MADFFDLLTDHTEAICCIVLAHMRMLLPGSSAWMQALGKALNEGVFAHGELARSCFRNFVVSPVKPNALLAGPAQKTYPLNLIAPVQDCVVE
jgi:hypothetical protein